MQVNGGSSTPSRRGRFLRKRSAGGQDFELNLAPIIDCLTVLITFTLVSASYLSVGIIQAEVAAASSAPVEQSPTDVTLSIELRSDKSIAVKLGGKVKRTHRIDATGGDWNWNALTDHLAFVKSEWPQLQSAVLVADNSVDYREVVKSMEITKKAVPSVLLGGF